MAKPEKANTSTPHKMASVQIYMDIDGDKSSDEYQAETPFEFALESQRLIRTLIQQQVVSHLGEEYEVVDLEISEGSVLIAFVIAKSLAFFASPAGQLALDISRYEAFVKSVTLIAAQSTKAIKAVMGMRFKGMTATSSFQVSPEVAGASVAAPVQRASTLPDLNVVMLGYLVLSHAALLALFGWLIVKHLH